MKVVCMCWCTFMIRQRHVCVHVHVAIRRHSSNSSNSMHLFWDSVFHWPGSHITDYAPWPVSPRDPPASAYPAPGWQVEASMPAFLFLFHFFFKNMCPENWTQVFILSRRSLSCLSLLSSLPTIPLRLNIVPGSWWVHPSRESPWGSILGIECIFFR